MFRKIYLDIVKNKLASGHIRWLLARGWQYARIQASSVMRRPLCGPALGTLVTNYRCTYRCIMCDLPLREHEFRSAGLTEMGTAGMKRVIDGFGQLGTPGIGFTGGEPLLREDIFELLSYTKDLGMVSHLNTNGLLLDDRRCRALFAARVDSLNISLDGARSNTHDAIRGHAGAFDAAIAAVERTVAMRRNLSGRLRIKTVTVLQPSNIDEAGDILRLAGELGVDCVEFIPCQPFPGESRTDQDAQFLRKVDAAVLLLSTSGLHAVRIENSQAHLDLFAKSFRNEHLPLRCAAGYASLAVDCYGEVYPCVPWYNWRRSAGNVRDQGLKALWYSPAYQQVRLQTQKCRKCYLNCQAELSILFSPFRRTAATASSPAVSSR